MHAEDMKMSKNNLAPVVLFCYNRLDCLKKTVEALQKNELAQESDLFIYSDGLKPGDDSGAVFGVREYLKTISGFKSIHITEAETNKGLANSIVDGVTEIVNQYGRIIVLEDDLVTSPYFLSFMNEALDLYADDDRVCCIHGYSPKTKQPLPKTYFLKGADCWGWATWARGWAVFHQDIDRFLDAFQDKKLRYELEFNGAYPYYQMLLDRKHGLNNSWAISWLCSAFLAGKLCLYSGIILVQHIGISGTHCKTEQMMSAPCSLKNPCPITKIPVEVSQEAYQAYSTFYKRKPLIAFFCWIAMKTMPSFLFDFCRKVKHKLLS